MATVYIPPLLRALTGDIDTLEIPGTTVGQVVEELERRFPGMKERLCSGDSLRAGLTVVVENEVARQGLSAPLRPTSEVHFLPAIGGG